MHKSILLTLISWGKNGLFKPFMFTFISVFYCRQQSEEGDKNGSEEDDEEKPGKRIVGPRKKFVWDDKLR